MTLRHLSRSAACGLGLLLPLCSSLPSAYAEGTKNWYRAWGVNRVVRTTQGYVSVSGAVDIAFVMPVEEGGGVTKITEATNPYDNKSTAYLGCEGGFNSGGSVEVDAGLQFETKVLFGVRSGWSVNISNSRYVSMWDAEMVKLPESTRDLNRPRVNYTNPRVWIEGIVPPDPVSNPNGGAWQAWRGGTGNGQTGGTGSIQSTMRYDTTANGEARLMLGAFGQGTNTFYWNQESRFIKPPEREAVVNGHRISPWVGERIFDVSRNADARVKRVAGLTRAEPYKAEPDGSTVTCTFTLCKVAPVGGGLRDWLPIDVEQSRTGYDAPGDGTTTAPNHLAWDRLWFGLRTFTSRNIVEFSSASVRPAESVEFDQVYNTAARAGMHQANRYVTETVRINLGTATRPVGGRLE